VRVQPLDLDAGLDGRLERSRVTLQVGDDVVARDESLWVVAVIWETRQVHRPIRSDEAEAVPATAPGVADAPALKYHVVDARLGELVADRQARLATTHDDDLIVRQGPVDLTRADEAPGSQALHSNQDLLVRVR